MASVYRRILQFLLVLLMMQGSLAGAQDADEGVPVRGDRLSGVVIPVLPRASDIRIHSLRADAWTVDDTKRAVLAGNVTISIGTYSFQSDRAVIWINRLPTAEGTVSQLAVYLPDHVRSTSPSGIGAEGSNLLVVGSTRGEVTIDTALLNQGRPVRAVGLVRRADARLANYVRRLIASHPPLTEHPQVIRDLVDGLDDMTMDATANEGSRGWLRFDRGRVSITASDVQFEPGESEGVLTATGGVVLAVRGGTMTGDIQDIQMAAQRAVVFTAPGGVRDLASGSLDASAVRGIYLEGNVVVDANNGKYLVRAPKAYYDFETGQALLLEAVLRTYARRGTLPIYARAKELRQVAASQWEAGSVQVSTTAFTTPDLAIGSSRMTLTQVETDEGTEVMVDSADNTVRFGGMPVFYWPRYRGRAAEIPLEGLRVGYRKNVGMMLETRWDPFILLGMDEPDGISADLHADVYSKRGAGMGLDFDYNRGGHRGTLELYGMTDSGTQRTTSGIEMDVETNHRGYAMWTDEFSPSRSWTIQSQLSWISDPTFMSVWRRPEFANRREFETGVYAKYQEGNGAFTALGTYDLNTFISNNWLLASRQYSVEKTPELALYRFGDSFLDGRITWSSEFRFSRMRMVFPDGTPNDLGLRTAAFVLPGGARLGGDDPISDIPEAEGLTQQYVNRLSTRQEFAMPLSFGPINVTPFFTGLLSRDFNDDTANPQDDDRTRWMASVGVRASTQFQRIYNGVENRLLDLHRMRHVIEPYATLWYGHTNGDPMAIPQYDAKVDNISKGTAAWLGVRNRLQTWRGGPGRWYEVDWLTLDTALLLTSNNATQRYSTPSFYDWRPEYSSLDDAAIVRGWMQYSDGVGFFGSSVWELGGGNVERASIGVELDHGRDVRASVEYREIRSNESQILQANLQYDLTKRYTVRLRPSWNFKFNDLQNLSLSVTRHYPDFDFITFVTYNKIQDETQFGANLNLLNF